MTRGHETIVLDSAARTVAESMARVVDRVCSEILQDLEPIREISRREVVKAGDKIEQILDATKKHVDELESLGRELTREEGLQAGETLGTVMDRQLQFLNTLPSLFHSVEQQAQMQMDLAEKAQHCTSEIQEFVKKVDSISVSSRILSVNAQIEAVNAGVHGHTFQIVANDIKDLNNTLKTANKSIAELCDSLTAILPKIVREATQMSAICQENFSQVSQAATDYSRTQNRLASAMAAIRDSGSLIRDLSNELLGHLQFQSLIENTIARAESRCRALMDGLKRAQRSLEDVGEETDLSAFERELATASMSTGESAWPERSRSGAASGEVTFLRS